MCQSLSRGCAFGKEVTCCGFKIRATKNRTTGSAGKRVEHLLQARQIFRARLRNPALARIGEDDDAPFTAEQPQRLRC